MLWVKVSLFYILVYRWSQTKTGKIVSISLDISIVYLVQNPKIIPRERGTIGLSLKFAWPPTFRGNTKQCSPRRLLYWHSRCYTGLLTTDSLIWTPKYFFSDASHTSSLHTVGVWANVPFDADAHQPTFALFSLCQHSLDVVYNGRCLTHVQTKTNLWCRCGMMWQLERQDQGVWRRFFARYFRVGLDYINPW